MRGRPEEVPSDPRCRDACPQRPGSRRLARAIASATAERGDDGETGGGAACFDGYLRHPAPELQQPSRHEIVGRTFAEAPGRLLEAPREPEGSRESEAGPSPGGSKAADRPASFRRFALTPYARWLRPRCQPPAYPSRLDPGADTERRTHGGGSTGSRDGREAPLDLMTMNDYHLVMKNVRIADLKAHLSEHLRRVRRGQTVTVLDRNTPIARIVPLAVETRDLVIHRPRRRRKLSDVPLPPPARLRSDVVELLLEDRNGGR